MINENVIAYHEARASISEYMSKVYGWMAGALSISAAVAWWAANSPAFIDMITKTPAIMYGLIFGELILVIGLVAMLKRMSLGMAIFAFLGYAVLTGLTLSTIFMIYTAASIAKTFIVTAGVFGAMSIYGYTTKKDLTSWGSFLIMSLIGLVIASLVNMFLNSHMIEWITTYAGIIIFTGLTAYDTQKLKYFGAMGAEGEMLGKMAILGALTLYLDFINLFLMLLRVFGNRR